MAKVALFLVVICLAGLLEECVGFNYYWPNYAGTQDLLSYPQIPSIAALWQPDCEKGKGKKAEGSSESSSSENSSGESKESKEGKESEEEGSKEGKSSAEEGGSSSKEEKEEKKEGKEGSKEESGEKKEAPKKKKNKEKESKSRSLTYTFPARSFQQIMYTPQSSYSYMPYRASYVVQQPVASYPVRNSYQYISLPSSATLLNGYTSPVVSRMVSNPMAKVVYSPPAVAKTVVAPGARVYSMPAAWNSPVGYLKK